MKKTIGIIIFLIIICTSIRVSAADFMSDNLNIDYIGEEAILYGFKLNNNQITINDVLTGDYFEEGVQLKNFDILGNEITDTSKGLGTGNKIEAYQDEELLGKYTTVIYGDTTGDGTISAVDALNLIKAVNKKVEYASPMCEEAGKIMQKDKNATPTAIDALAIIKHLNNKYEIKQNKSSFYWDRTSDAKKDITTKTTLNFKVVAKDENGNKIEDITWEVSEGTLDTESGTSVNWTIPSVEKTYKITAKKDENNILEKEIEYIDVMAAFEGLALETEEIEIEQNEDEDADGLTNIEEHELGTEIFHEDTDADGLNDYEEVKTYRTDPLKTDTDGDGIADLNEILLDFDPLKQDSDGNGISDNKEKVEYTAENTDLGINIQMKGNANIADTLIDTVEINELDNIEAVVSPIYSFYTEGELKSANVEISYNENEISEKGILEEDLSLYYFNPENYTFEQVESEVDITNNKVKTTLNHFSMYLIADKTKMITKLNNQIMFLVDNSASMYTPEQAIEKNQNEEAEEGDFAELAGNDSEYKRLEIISRLVNKLDDNFEFGLTKFTGDDTTLCELGESKEEIEAGLEQIKTGKENFNGTYIATTVYSAVSDFSANSAFGKYIVLISDGEDTAPVSGILKSWAISRAKNNGVKIITIGLGNELNQQYLRDFSEQTGGKYYYIQDANMLENLYNSLQSELNLKRDTIADENGEEEDYLVVADSGFASEINGLPFDNYRTIRSNGQCYGIAQLAKKMYMGNLELAGSTTRKYLGETIDFNYDLSSLQLFNSYGNLMNYKFTSKALEKIFTASNEEMYDYDKLDKDANAGIEKPYLQMREEFKEYIEQTNGVIITETRDGNSGRYGKILVDFVILDMDAITQENLEKFPDLQLFKAIEYLFMTQLNEEGDNAKDDINVILKDFEDLEYAIERINEGTPVVISYETYSKSLVNTIRLWLSKMNHAVNGIKILRSTENPNKYKIAIYNNNSSGETEYLEVEKIKTLFGTSVKCYEQSGNRTTIGVEK